MKPGASQLPRPLVAARMRRALDDGCLLVVAPAGYGKTLAIQQAVEEHGGAAVWHACRDRDADGGRLVVSILEAVRRTVPGAADVLLDRLGHALDAVARLPDPPAPMAVLGALLEGAGGPLRLVVASRRRPPLKLAKLTAAGRGTELGGGDPVFTAEECGAVLEARNGRPATDAEVEATMSRTLGWPLGVALGAERVAGEGASIEQFLVEEILDALDAPTRRTLLDSSV